MTEVKEKQEQLSAQEQFVLPPPKSQLEELWLQLKANRLAFFGMIIFVGFFVIALLGLIVTTGTRPILDPSTVRLEEKLRPPFSRPSGDLLTPDEMPRLGLYIFGTDNLGRDVFVRMLQGAWVSLTVGFVAVGISVIIGIIFGGISGYYGQNPVRVMHVLAVTSFIASITLLVLKHCILAVTLLFIGIFMIILSVKSSGAGTTMKPFFAPIMSIDTLIMRFVDIMICFPSFFLILTVVALLPASMYNIMVVIGLTSWMGTTRFVRAEFLSLRDQDFVTAARALGVSNVRIIFRHMIPNAIAPVLVSATIGIAGAILTEAGLSFLGFGVPPPHATWGNILSSGKNFLFDAPWLTFIPGLAILIVVLSFNLFGEALRDILNPKLGERA
jgi:peptide/nickel transport system permease protein